VTSMARTPRHLFLASVFGVLPATGIAIYTAFQDVPQAVVIFLIGLALSAVILLIIRRSP
jgi:ATP-dependent protease ClpP protease subunit